MTHDTKQLGNTGEQLATDYLQQQGYHIIATNWRAGRLGEIDIIAQHQHTVVFVEVKSRRGKDALEKALAAITPHKQQQLFNIAEHYLAENPSPQGHTSRVDVIAIDMSATPPRIHHVENAITT